MQITKYHFTEATDEKTAIKIMSFLARSTISAEFKQWHTLHKRKGKLVNTIVSLKHYDIDEVIKYCNEHSTLSHAQNCLDACALIMANK